MRVHDRPAPMRAPAFGEHEVRRAAEQRVPLSMKRPLVGSDADDRFHRPSVARLTIEMATE